MRKLLGLLMLAIVTTMTAPLHAQSEATKAINFEFTDINGQTIRLSDFRGKWVLVNFWAPWCPLCWVEVPTLNELNKRKDFVVIGVGLDYGPDANVVRDSVKRHNLDFHANVAGGSRRNPDSPFRQVGPVDFYPTSYIYDPNGEIVMFIPGQVRMNRVLAFMEDYTNRKTQFADGKSTDVAPNARIREATQTAPQATKPAPRPATQPAKPASRPRTVTY